MNEFNDHDRPTPEFRASLDREIARAFRSERQFEPAARTSRTRRLGMVIGLAMGAVITLTIGLVLGASTGYASAEVLLKESGDTTTRSRPALAIIPMRNALSALTCGSIAAAPLPTATQQAIPLIDR